MATPLRRAGAQQQQQPAATKAADDKAKVVITPIGTACFVHVWEPFAFPAKPGQAAKEPNYSLMLVFNSKELEKDPAWKALRVGVSTALKAKFGEAKLKDLLRKGKLSLPWRDAAEYSDYGPPFEDGNTMISLKSRNAPGVVNERSQPIMQQPDFYPGCLARCSALPWAFDSMGNQGCTLLLNNVQKAGDGERLAGGRTNAEDEFAPLQEGSGSDDIDDLIG